MDRRIWLSKFRAAGVHASVTVLLAGVTAFLVFGVWYPGEFSTMMRGGDIYRLVLLVEVLLGPTISLVIYNPDKPLTELLRDYSVTSSVQLVALVYGLYVVAQSRPEYVVFVKDSLEVVTPVELDQEDVEAAQLQPYRRLTLGYPRLVCTESPSDPVEKSELLFSALEGKDIQLFPKYYRPCKEGEIVSRAIEGHILRELASFVGTKQAILDHLPDGEFSWLPVKHRFGAWVVVYPENSLDNARYLPIYPYEKVD